MNRSGAGAVGAGVTSNQTREPCLAKVMCAADWMAFVFVTSAVVARKRA